ncbi:MAG: hypothetical protein IT428_15730 [Planctomycetaceae bacterium]|nr:hypothetical protein [Planctomycetaceae bacterium]
MARNGRKFADDTLILELSSGKSVPEAANAAGVGDRTVYRRLSDPAFQTRLAEAKKTIVARALEKLSESSVAAVETLVVLLKSDADTVRLSAAKAILETGLRMKQMVELEDRLRRLEDEEASRKTGSTMARSA